MNQITIDDFSKIDLRIGKILEAERVKDSEKLIRFKIDLGSEVKQILAGIGKTYTPEELIGKEVPVVANLESRMMAGYESQGMLLAAGDGKVLTLLMVDREILPGAKIR